jgi:hypothetical protein
MKNILIIISILTISLNFIACEKNNVVKDGELVIYEPGNMEFGFATFDKNGLSAKASGEAVRFTKIKDTYFLRLNTYQTASNGIAYQRETYSIRQIPFGKIGKYTIHFDDLIDKINVLGSFSSTIDSHTLNNGYYIDASKDNYVNILSVDSSRVTGTFQMYLKITKPENLTDEPDSLKITSGVFDVKMKNL